MRTETTTPAAAAGQWRLGELTVNRLGFGAMRIMGRDHAVDVLRRAVELGVNHIDTANFYRIGDSAANDLIRAALHPYPDGLVIATKVGPDFGNPATPREAGPDELRGQVERDLRELGLDHFDLVNLRIGADLGPATGSLADRFGALAELREKGLIRELGVSNVDVEQLAEAEAIAPVVAVQNQYGLGNQAADAVLDRTTERGIAFVPFFAIAEGAEPAALAEIARRHGVTAAQVRLAWTLHRAPNVLAIPGTGDLAHLEQNVAAAAIRLDPDEVRTLGGPASAG